MRRYDDELDFDESLELEDNRKKYIVFGVVAAVLVLLIAVIAGLSLKKEPASGGAPGSLDTEISSEQNPAGGQAENADGQMGEVLGSEEITEVSTDAPTVILVSDRVVETAEVTDGIDVAKYQGIIDWKQVADAGIDFAMIRVGYRTMESGVIKEDDMAKYNMQEASANGVKLGVYFFSTAITEEEAKEEADWVADYIAQYPITYPVAYDCEGFDKQTNRHYSLSKEERTNLAAVFMVRIYERGYTPMFYGAKNELTSDLKWETSKLEKRYKVWVSQYSAVEKTDYTGAYAMWQCSNQGSVPGIEGNVDLNIAYFGYEGTAEPLSVAPAPHVTASIADIMDFVEVQDTVTAKDVTNLRDIPSQGGDSTVMAKLKNGETATRIGISDSGWSKVMYQGEIYYAVSNYLTTDLTVVEKEEPATEDDGIKTEFTACNEIVTAKIEVNLRTLPSVTNPDAQVVAVLKNGENITRTGINHDVGWSRVEYNGQILYCVSSYLKVVQ